MIAEQATSLFQTKPLAAAQAVDNTLIEVEATEEVSEDNDTKSKEDTAVEAAIPEKNDKETWEAPDESITIGSIRTTTGHRQAEPEHFAPFLTSTMYMYLFKC